MVVDSGDFGAVFEKALEQADVKGFAKRKEESKRRGKLRGLGRRELHGSHRAAE